MRNLKAILCIAIGLSFLGGGVSLAERNDSSRGKRAKVRDHRGKQRRHSRRRHSRRRQPMIAVDLPVAVEVHVDGPSVEVHTSQEVEARSVQRRKVRYETRPRPTPRPSYLLSYNPTYVRNWHIGVNWGAGTMNRRLGNSLALHAGLRISKFALQAEYWAQFPGANFETENSQALFMLAGQYWFQKKLWVKVGVGSSLFKRQEGTSLLAALGYDFAQVRDLVLDVQVRAGAGFYKDAGSRGMISAALGVTWY